MGNNHGKHGTRRDDDPYRNPPLSPASGSSARVASGGDLGEDVEKEILAKIATARQTFALDLQGLKLRALPKGLFDLKELSALNVSSNELTALEDEVVRLLPALTSLRINGNKLTGLPSLGSGALKELEVLDVGKNRLRSLPGSVGDLSALVRLIAHCNLLEDLPPGVGELANLTVLDLSTNNLKQLPPEVGKLHALKSLDIDNNRLKTLPPEFGDLGSLTQLTCASNLFSHFPDSICRLGFLKTLNISCNRITQLPAAIAQLGDSITELDLSGNRFVTFPQSLAGCRSLITLDFHDNYLCDLADNISQLCELATLNLSHNKLTTLPRQIGEMTVLMELNLSQNKIAHLPPELGHLSFLGKLYLSRNALDLLPIELSNIAFIQELDLSNNGLDDIPIEIFKLDKLQTLKLDCNNLTHLPPELGHLFRLQHLYVSNNQLTSLPAEISQLSRLQVLSIYQNAIKQLPDGMGALKHIESICLGDNLLDESGLAALEKATMPALEQLVLSGNRLTSIPEGLCNLASLKELYLSRNEIAELPEAITRLNKIRIFDLSDNAIAALPSYISSLHSLREINLSYNRLSSLPPEFVKLTNLCVLYLMHNNLTDLPEDLQAMRNRNCYHMDLEDNLIPDLALLLGQTKRKKRKRTTSKLKDADRLTKSKDEKSRVAGISEMMGKRPSMEDTVSSHLAFSGIDGEDFFAVFDGHAGRASAVFAADHFHGVLAKKVMEENGQGVPAKRRGSRDKGKEKEGASDEGKQKKSSFWNKRAAKRSRELSRVKTNSGELTDVAAAERTEGKDKEEEGDMSDLSSRMSAEGQQQEAEQEQEDSDEEPINFPKGVGEDSSKEAQATFSALIKSFLEMDELMKDNRDGATAVVTLASMRLNKLFVANVGDARAVLCRRGKAFPLTVDHTPKLVAESERIRALHGFVTSNRVNGVIAISRSLGDASMKPYVSAEPGTCVVNLCREDQFLILACDGCWDTVDNQTAVDIVSHELAASGNPAKAAIKLRDHAFWKGSTDNISVIVVLLDRYLPSDSPVASSSSSCSVGQDAKATTPRSRTKRAKKRSRTKEKIILPKSSESEPNLAPKSLGATLERNRRSMSDVMGSPPEEVSGGMLYTSLNFTPTTTGNASGGKAKKPKKGSAVLAAATEEESVHKDKKKNGRKEKKVKKLKKRKKPKERRERSRSRSVADAEDCPQFGRNRALSADKDAAISRQTRSSSLSEESLCNSRKVSKESLVDAGTDDSVPPQSSEHMLLDSKQRNATRAGRSGSVGK